ncbi:Serine/threonine-protein kinase/endoribonuclease IRE1 [Morus notabilis]|uniref:Serine/threonine-protein kinase/endoribonuclease IRE1 n=1 Tax=Morus notabilis TaxID=981085 RepID=W9SR62_9ROSA|nr:Serine/threonine-protein kinase/endoribonuclease IRE1 [Morus notabilis]
METHPDLKPSHPAEASKPKPKSNADAVRPAPASSAIPRNAVNASIVGTGNNVTPAATSSTASLQKWAPRRFGDQVISVAKNLPKLVIIRGLDEIKGTEVVSGDLKEVATNYNLKGITVPQRNEKLKEISEASSSGSPKRAQIQRQKNEVATDYELKGKKVPHTNEKLKELSEASSSSSSKPTQKEKKVPHTNEKLKELSEASSSSSKPTQKGEKVPHTNEKLKQLSEASSSSFSKPTPVLGQQNEKGKKVPHTNEKLKELSEASSSSSLKQTQGLGQLNETGKRIPQPAKKIKEISGASSSNSPTRTQVSRDLKEKKEIRSQEANEKWKKLPEAVKYLRNFLQKNVPMDEIKGIVDIEELKSLHNDLARYLEQEPELGNAFATVEVSSESDKCDPQQPLQIGQNLELLPDKKLSDGKNQDNNILWGTYKVPTAVKRIRKADYDMNAEKIQILIKDLKYHPNLVRCFGVTSDKVWSYVAMETAYYLDETSFNLDELVQLANSNHVVTNDRLNVVKKIVGKFELIPKNGSPIPDLLRTVMREVLSGLVHLHDTLGISHGDLKPQNIRIIKEGSLWHVKLSDMGIKTGSGTLDRQACRDHGNHIWVDDMHAYGRILCYCITGISEFGDCKTITKKRDSLLENNPEARHLFLCLTSTNPTERLTAKEALRYLPFSDPKEKLLFLLNTCKKVYDFGDRDLRNELETISSKVIVGKWKGEDVREWNERIDADIINYAIEQLKKYSPDSTYKYDSLPELLRLIRNTYNHYGRCPPKIKRRGPDLKALGGRGARRAAACWTAVQCHSMGSTALQKSARGCSRHNGSA